VNGRPQQCCGCSVKRNGIPFTAVVLVELDKDDKPMAFNVQLRSLAAINGVITITESGMVHSFNENFLHALVGRELGSAENVMVSFELKFWKRNF
jgi:hypothetical protein